MNGKKKSKTALIQVSHSAGHLKSLIYSLLLLFASTSSGVLTDTLFLSSPSSSCLCFLLQSSSIYSSNCLYLLTGPQDVNSKKQDIVKDEKEKTCSLTMPSSFSSTELRTVGLTKVQILLLGRGDVEYQVWIAQSRQLPCYSSSREKQKKTKNQFSNLVWNCESHK